MYPASLRVLVIALVIGMMGVFPLTASHGSIVDGWAYKEGESNHSGIAVKCLTCDFPQPTKYTNASGHFGPWWAISGGRYHKFEYSHDGFWTDTLRHYIPPLSSETLPDVTLQRITSDTLGPGDVIIEDHLIVASGHTLTILPGTRLLFKGQYKLTVQGQLLAVGTAQDSIIFTHYYQHPDSTWWGIRLDGARVPTRLEYCRIEYGKADGDYNDGYGGGISCQDCDATIRHCNVKDNWARYSGGGIFVATCGPTIDNCTIGENEAWSGWGGGIHLQQAEGTVITDCRVTNNKTWNYGGGICCSHSFPRKISGCVIDSNWGGEFGQNGYGGGIACFHAEIDTLEDCLIFGNVVWSCGGGIGCDYESYISYLSGCTITDNEAIMGPGGGLWFSGHSNAEISRSVVAGNLSGYVGGGIYCRESSWPRLTNCTFVENEAQAGGALGCEVSSSPIFKNCIMWQDIPDEIYRDYTCNPTLAYCDVDGGWSGQGNIDCDPLFDEDHHLTWDNYPIEDSTKSCCIDSGDPDPDYDDPDGTRNDIGAFYFQQQISMFTPGVDDWQFENYKSNMWPESWWSQFDYTSYPYPWYWQYFCNSQDFPDWPLFVELFGESQCYWDPPPGIVVYKKRAELYWRIIVESYKHEDQYGVHYWPGSCFGFSISSLLYYNNYRSVESDFGCFALYDVALTDSSRKVVNKYNPALFGKEHLDDFLNGWKKTPRQTLAELKQMLAANSENNRILSMFPEESDRFIGHGVVPCSLAQDGATPGLYHVHIYDSYAPGEYRIVDIDSAAGTWQNWWGWSGSKGLFLMDEVSEYVGYPTIPGMFPLKGGEAGEPSEGEDAVPIFNTSSCDIVISNLEGDSIGHVESSGKGATFVAMENASPILSSTPDIQSGRPPVGYLVPPDAYDTRISNSRDSILYFSVFSDSAVLWYGRNDCRQDQTDHLGFSEGGRRFETTNLDEAAKNISFKGVSPLPDREMTAEFKNLDLSLEEGFVFEIVDRTCFKVSNEGGEKAYDLTLELGTRELNPFFTHDGVPLGEGCVHRICPDWELLDVEPVAILIDCDSDGEFEDMMYVENQWERSGDIKRDGSVDLGDVVYLINYLFKDSLAPEPLRVADVNGDEAVDIGDVVYLVGYLYKSGPPPVSK